MPDINFAHLDSLFLPFNEEVAEHYGYLAELNALDLSSESDAIHAIRKWVLPENQKLVGGRTSSNQRGAPLHINNLAWWADDIILAAGH